MVYEPIYRNYPLFRLAVRCANSAVSSYGKSPQCKSEAVNFETEYIKKSAIFAN